MTDREYRLKDKGYLKYVIHDAEYQIQNTEDRQHAIGFRINVLWIYEHLDNNDVAENDWTETSFKKISW